MSSSCHTSLDQEQLYHSLSPVYPAIGPPSFPSGTGSFVQIDCRLKGSLTETCAHRETRKWSTDGGRCRVTIDVLPDVALLEIFNYYMYDVRRAVGRDISIAWHNLVHVCQKWRSVVFGSPRRLDLRLYCRNTTPVKETLAVWPPLPIIIEQYDPSTQVNNIVAALEHNDRVCQISVWELTNSQFEEVLPAMQQPFPALTELDIWLSDADDGLPVIPESFLGGSAPRLQHQHVNLYRIPFPGLPKLLLSATGLVRLHLVKIPYSGYISPEAMVCCLSTLTRLEDLAIGFESPLSRPVRETRRPHPTTRSALPTLTFFWFEGVSEYLEDIAAWIDAPLLDTLNITFFHQLIFSTPQLAQFLTRTPNIQPLVEATVSLSNDYVYVTSPGGYPSKFVLRISCRQLDWQLSSLSQVYSSSLPDAFISTVERLYICEDIYEPPRWQDDIEDSQWLEVLHPFTAVKYLYLSSGFAPHIVPTLQEVAGQVLPSLQNLFSKDLHLSGPVQEAIGKFVAARQLAGYPIAVSNWDGNNHRIWKDEW